jgi:hypothetical protein
MQQRSERKSKTQFFAEEVLRPQSQQDTLATSLAAKVLAGLEPGRSQRAYLGLEDRVAVIANSLNCTRVTAALANAELNALIEKEQEILRLKVGDVRAQQGLH